MKQCVFSRDLLSLVYELDPSFETLLCEFPYLMARTEPSIVRAEIIAWPGCQPLVFIGSQRDSECLYDAPRQSLLKIEDVIELSRVPLGPEMGVG